MRYSCNDIFMVRTPSLPASVFSDFVQFEGNDVENFLQQTPFRDFMDKSILLSSRELYNAKKRNLQSSTKKSKARNLARIKFLIRACTRPTPYGLFAGAALGEFCENPNIEPLVIDERKAILECRADYSWLSHFIYEMENNPSVYPQLQLRFNNNCYVSGDRLKNPHHSNHGFLMPEETVTERTHMRNTPLITYVKQQAQTFIRYDLLKSRIQSKYPGVPEEKIISTINALMENEVLLSNLRAPANCENGLEYVLKILAPIEGIDRQKETLQKINTLINQMNGELEIDQVNAKTIESVYTLMDGLLNQKNEKDLLAVNKGMVLQQNKLPYQVKEIVEQFVEALTYAHSLLPPYNEPLLAQSPPGDRLPPAPAPHPWCPCPNLPPGPPRIPDFLPAELPLTKRNQYPIPNTPQSLLLSSLRQINFQKSLYSGAKLLCGFDELVVLYAQQRDSLGCQVFLDQGMVKSFRVAELHQAE